MPLWMAEGGTVFNRQMSASYPPTWSNLPPPITPGIYHPLDLRPGTDGERFPAHRASHMSVAALR